MKKRTPIPCKRCIWAKRISENKFFCPFPKCVKEELPTGQNRRERGKPNGRETGMDS